MYAEEGRKKSKKDIIEKKDPLTEKRNYASSQREDGEFEFELFINPLFYKLHALRHTGIAILHRMHI